MRCFYHPDYFLELPQGHPFPMEKFPDAYEIVKNQVHIQAPDRLQLTDIQRVHSTSYLEAVNFDQGECHQVGLSRYDRNRLGLPASPILLERSMLETSGTVSATLAALADGVACNLAGGTHHAFPSKGLGFCVLNDIAISIEYLRATQNAPQQILIIDTDAHQGNANNAYFQNAPNVFTYSIHVGKNYPAKKEAGDCDVELERYISGTNYLKALKSSLPPVFADTEPDLIYWISGADPHRNDRFGQMQLSTEQLDQRNQYVLELCKYYACPTVVVYGGGYNKTANYTGALHARAVLTTKEILG